MCCCECAAEFTRVHRVTVHIPVFTVNTTNFKMYHLPILHLVLVLTSIFKANGETGNGALRLIRDNQYSDTQAWSSGIVQIYYGDSWGNICEDLDFSFDEADVTCHQLGYTGASSYGTTSSIAQYGTDGNATLIEDVSCSVSDYLTLLQCSIDDQYSTECSNDNLDLVINCYTTRIWDSPYLGQIRLTGGKYSNQGLLEIYCNGQWGTVCDDVFGGTDARVTCRQLGYNYYYTYDTLPQRGNESQSIWLNNIGCTSSTYNCLSSCSSGACTSSAISNCVHSEDITLDCSYSSSYTASFVTEETCDIGDTVGPNGVGAIRLLNSGSTSLYNTAGRVQVWYGGEWGNICDGDTNFGSDEADVVCHQLGWSGSSSYSTGQDDSYGNDGLPAVIDDLSCFYSTYLTIFQCSYSTSISSSCTSDNDVSVSCYTTRIWNNPYVGQIRLARGMYSNQGLLEVYCNDEWGTVCDDTFGNTDASVVCRQLGYNTYYSYDHLSITGNFSQPIWLDNVQCFSSSTSCLAYCETCPSSEYHDCTHSEDITVECSISTFGSVSTRVSTCTNADSGPTDSTGPTDSSGDSVSTINVGGLVGGIIAGTFFIIILSVCLPLCICGVAGVGIGSSFRRTPRTNVVGRTTGATTATVLTTETISTNIETPTNAYSTNPQNPPPSYPAQGYNEKYPTQQQGYPQQQNYPQQSQPYPGQQGYPMTPYSTQPQQPPPTYPAYPYPPGGSEYPPQQAPYPNQDTSNIQQQPPPPYPGAQSTQFGFPEPQPF